MSTLLLVLSAAIVTPQTQILPWDDAEKKAEALVGAMDHAEKASLMLGVGWAMGTLRKWWYVGNTPPMPRLGLPSLNMQDAAGGFRPYWSEMVGQKDV